MVLKVVELFLTLIWSKYRAVVTTGSTGSIEPVDFWKRHNGTCEIAKMIRIESVNFQDIVTLEPVISKTLRQP